MNYPLLNLFWTIFEVFLWVVWFWILITVFIDIFRSSDLNGWGKALWFLFVLLIPLVGVLVYLIARGGEMHNRAAKLAEQQDAAARSYIREAATDSTPSGPAGQARGPARPGSHHRRGVPAAEGQGPGPDPAGIPACPPAADSPRHRLGPQPSRCRGGSVCRASRTHPGERRAGVSASSPGSGL